MQTTNKEEAMRRRRLEAWANEYHDGMDLHHSPMDALRCADHFQGASRVAVRLVECGLDEVVMHEAAAAVVREAVRWAEAGDVRSECQSLVNAVERLLEAHRRH